MIRVTIIPSKSDAHRALICAALSDSPCEVVCPRTSRDIEATKQCLATLLDAPDGRTADLRCGESGSTFRFLLPIVGALGKAACFHPEGRLAARPLSPLYQELVRGGMTLSPEGTVPFFASGQLYPGTYTIPGSVSSQFVSGLLFALPLLPSESVLRVEGGLQSAGYVRMTENTIRKFGVRILEKQEGNALVFRIPGGQRYRGPAVYRVEGDWSNAAFWLAAGVLGKEAVAVDGLSMETAQGDRAVVPILRAFGGKIEETEEGPGGAYRVTALPSRGNLHGVRIDARDIPDLVPVLALTASLAEGETRIEHAERLRLKESDRLKTTAALLNGLGAEVEERPDGLRITGRKELSGGDADGAGDHRIVMTAAAASVAALSPVHIHGSGAAAKSYPGFFEEWERAGLAGNLTRD